MNNPKYVVFLGKDKQYYFHLNAANGEIILQSEGYTQKHNCVIGIASVKTNSPNDERYQRKTARDGSPYFNLTAANGEIIGTSEMYSSVQMRDNGIESVKNYAPDAPIDDTTL